MPSFASEPPRDWTARYARYLQQSTARAARTGELNAQLLRRIADGEITPAILEREYTAFTAVRGTEFAEDVAVTSLRFLTELLQTGRGYAEEVAARIAPEAVTAEPGAPPTFEPGDWSGGFQRLSDYAAAENAAVAALLRTLMEQVASGALAPVDLQAAVADFSGENLPATMNRLASLFFDLLTRLDEIHSDFGARYLEAVLGVKSPAERAAGTVDVVGPSGGSATIRFAVTNDSPAPKPLRVVMTDVRRADGIGPAFEPDVRILPERLTLAPAAEEAISLTVRLDSTTFDAGPEYVGTLHVLSPGETVLAVPLRIRATVPTSGSADGSAGVPDGQDQP